jgi:hypothetical protein
MKEPFPHKQQYAHNLGNGSQEAVDRVNDYVRENGGSIEHKPLETIRTEVLKRLEKKQQ